ncbi:MAG: hypothetical protein PHC88_05665 [Terrimicrobiaceae bacterium]|nr:hypothetical protein [Terrimicrobiaceae bacterium]
MSGAVPVDRPNKLEVERESTILDVCHRLRAAVLEAHDTMARIERAL